MTWTAIQPDEDDGLVVLLRRAVCSQPQQVAERQARQAKEAGFDRRAARHPLAVLRRAGVFDSQHEYPP